MLGKGDFVQSLMANLAPQLTRPSNQLHRHHLLSLVETAVRSSAPVSNESSATRGNGDCKRIGWIGDSSTEMKGGDGDHALLLCHLDVTLKKTPGGLGWDAFCLDYVIGSPCNVVLSDGAMRLYRQTSTFLWRLKRVEHSLTAVWRKHCTTARLVRNMHKDETMHRCYLLRNDMVHLVSNLQYYLMFEVIECACVALDDALSQASDIEQVLSAHDTFLVDIERKAMLRREDEEMALALKALFESILLFARSQDMFYMSLLEQKAARKTHMAAARDTSDAVGLWGGGVAVEPRLVEQLDESATEYRSRFSAFYSLLRNHSSYDLSFLCFRLNFNECYQSMG